MATNAKQTANQLSHVTSAGPQQQAALTAATGADAKLPQSAIRNGVVAAASCDESEA